APDPAAGYALGVDIGRGWLRVAVVDLDGTVVGGGRARAPPAAPAPPPRVHVAVRTAADDVWTNSRDRSGRWSGWSSLGGTVSGSPTLVAVGDAVVLYARAADYTLWQQRYDGGAWRGWTKRQEFPSAAFDGSLGAVAGPDGSVDAVYRGVDGAVYRTQFK
ncbi:hypothetical protein ACWC2M_26060, partial [Streptomyces sp. NPDC001761]